MLRVFKAKWQWSQLPNYLATIMSVEGMTSASECTLLYNLAKQISTGCIVEIGSYRGRTTVALALGSLHGNKCSVFAIEPHEEFKGILGGEFGPKDRVAFFSNILKCGVAEIVHLVNMKSENVVKGWEREIALLWIDGDHTYEGVKKDFEYWFPFVRENGLIAFDDSLDTNLGPYKLINELLNSGGFLTSHEVGKIKVLRQKDVG